jgi:hypothetical protein
VDHLACLLLRLGRSSPLLRDAARYKPIPGAWKWGNWIGHSRGAAVRARWCDLASRPRASSGRAVNLGVFLQLNLPRTAGKSNTVISRTLLTKVSCWSPDH